MNTNESRVYIIESNYLAAQYIYGSLNNQAITNVNIIDSRSLNSRQPVDSNKCVLILDRPTMASALLSWGIKLRAGFPDSILIVIADNEFGRRAQQMFQSWIAGVIDYADLRQLPVVVLRALSTLSQRGEAGIRASSRSLVWGEVQFSRREKEVLELLCLRLSNKEIANLLDVTTGTIKFHISNIFSKMGLRRRRELFSQVDALVCSPTEYFDDRGEVSAVF